MLFKLITIILATLSRGSASNHYNFPSIYNFGDSNSDTGGGSAAFTAVPPPNGMTFFGTPSGRRCDGRLIIDFIAEQVKLPYLGAYLDSIGARSFKGGANFAIGGASIRPGGYSPFNLGVQISQFQQFKARTVDLYNHHDSKVTLPSPEDFSSALYTFDIGQNDLSFGFQHTTEDQVRASIPDILQHLITTIQQLYNEGARVFWVHNTGPHGCLPYSVIYGSKSGNLDPNGCVRSQNEVAQEFNRQLETLLTQLETWLPKAMIIYIDVYSAKYALISNAKSQGFVDPMRFCCGSYYECHVDCGKRVVVNSTVYGDACSDPQAHISWDGIHYSEAANRWVAGLIINGSILDPQKSTEPAMLH
ncbi:hypothetical protein Sjap_016081 [Stephania japonica]|uniref:Uncharacterized protein n=1 Tax=Stephania japonica TaxID=461633 RepID=A0AAP0IKD5_9MAGN